jgi:hypothetical protein
MLGSEKVETMTRMSSDSLIKAMPYLTGRRVDSDKETVHGGEYSVRPNMKESMVFLKKLYTHQNQHKGGPGYPGLQSPPDGPMRT